MTLYLEPLKERMLLQGVPFANLTTHSSDDLSSRVTAVLWMPYITRHCDSQTTSTAVCKQVAVSISKTATCTVLKLQRIMDKRYSMQDYYISRHLQAVPKHK